MLGARPLRRTVQREIEDTLAEKMLYGEVRPGQIILVDVEGEGTEAVFTFNGEQKSELPDLPPIEEPAGTGEVRRLDRRADYWAPREPSHPRRCHAGGVHVEAGGQCAPCRLSTSTPPMIISSASALDQVPAARRAAARRPAAMPAVPRPDQTA